MADRGSPRDNTDHPGPNSGGRDAPRDPARVAEGDAADALQPDAESSYRPAASPRGRATGHGGDAPPFDVRIEFVRLDGPEGQALRRRQAQSMRKVLRWIAEQHQAAAEAIGDTMQPTLRIDVEDGHVIATADSVLSDAAADVLWRVIEKAMRRDETK